MTETEYNNALKELDVVLLDVDYKKFDSVLDVAKFVIQLNKINEKILARENEELRGYESCINDFKAEGFDSAMSVKEYCKNYTKLLKENAELKEKMKCCGNCKHYSQESNYTIGVCKEKYDVEGNNICDNWELVE